MRCQPPKVLRHLSRRSATVSRCSATIARHSATPACCSANCFRNPATGHKKSGWWAAFFVNSIRDFVYSSPLIKPGAMPSRMVSAASTASVTVWMPSTGTGVASAGAGCMYMAMMGRR